jgi:hypothetical protein
MLKRSIEKLIDDTINSFDGANRAEPKPFLFTRVMASINNRSSLQNGWTRLGAFISRPGVAIAGLLLVLFLNVMIAFTSKNKRERPDTVQNNSIVKDEFSLNTISIYDIENPEQ